MLENKIRLLFSPSEFNRWGYCPLQWYLHKTTKRKPTYTQKMKDGEQYHQEKAAELKKVQDAQIILKKTAITGGVICFIFFLWLWLS